MITSNLKFNQLSPKQYATYRAYLTTMGHCDIVAYGQFLADDVVLRSNNESPTEGKKAAIEGLVPYWQSFAEIEHDLTNSYGTDQNSVLEAFNHYVRHDGIEVTVHAVAFTDLND